MPHDLPLKIGAALPVERLGEFRDWLFEADRDVELQSFHWPDVLDGDWQPLADEACRMLSGFKGRIGIHGPFWGFQINSMDPKIREVVTHRLMQGLDICEAVGALQMVIHSPYTPWDYNNMPMFPKAPERMIAEARATLDPVVARAERQGVTLVIENIQDKDPAVRLALIDAFESPAVRASIDTGHAHWAHGSAGAPPVDYYVKAAGERLAHVHLQDADGYADRHWPIGEGNILWPSVFQAIAALETRPHLVLELRDASGIPASMTYLTEAGLAC